MNDNKLDGKTVVGAGVPRRWPVLCGWCGMLLHKHGQVEGSTGICPACAERLRKQVWPSDARQNLPGATDGALEAAVVAASRRNVERAAWRRGLAGALVDLADDRREWVDGAQGKRPAQLAFSALVLAACVAAGFALGVVVAWVELWRVVETCLR